MIPAACRKIAHGAVPEKHQGAPMNRKKGRAGAKTGGSSVKKEDKIPAAGACGGFAANPFLPAASGCSPSACSACAAKSSDGACPSQPSLSGLPGEAHALGLAAHALAPGLAADGQAGGEEDVSLPEPTPEERAAILAMDLPSAVKALKADDPVTVAVTTEFIVRYSLKVAQTLRESDDFLHVVTPEESMPAVERIAMGIVREAVSESLAMEASGMSA
jgi:hypothetical protein